MPKPIHYLEHASDVLAHAIRLADGGHKFALVTATGIKGGSARELGTLALVAEDGEMFGYLSNGCIDRDIQMQGQSVAASGTAQMLHYGAGSPFLDLTLPCGGSLSLLLDPNPDMAALRSAYDALIARRPATVSFTPLEGETLTFTYAPKPMLVIAGRGSVFRSMASLGAEAGFELALLSPEEDDLDALKALAPRHTTHLTTPNSEIEINVDANAAFLTLFHDHDWEPHLLLKALTTPARFIGCLGSRRTHAKRCEALKLMGADPDSLERIQGPLGLVPSLRQAPLIAVSALAHITESFPRAIELVEA